MNQREKQLLNEEAGGAEPRLCLRTDQRMDTGRWGRHSPVWLCVMEDALILLAVGRRRYLDRVPLADCRTSHYAHATGELVIEPAETLTCSRLAMPPREALNVLDLLKTDTE